MLLLFIYLNRSHFKNTRDDHCRIDHDFPRLIKFGHETASEINRKYILAVFPVSADNMLRVVPLLRINEAV